MRFCAYYSDAPARERDLRRRFPCELRYGAVLGDVVHSLEIPGELWQGPLAWADEALFALPRLSAGDPIGPVDGLFLAPPIPRPAQMLDFYAFEEHVRRARAQRGLQVPGEWFQVPAYYNSTTTALYGSGQPVPFPHGEDRMDFELELACVIGRTIRNATPAQARAAIAGYMIMNDLSARSRQRTAMAVGLGPCPGKDFGSVFGPWLVTSDEIADPAPLLMEAFVNGTRWASGTFGTIYYSFAEMIVYASKERTLFPGDIIGSGTLGGGCGLELERFLKPGDTVRLTVSGIGSLETIIAEGTDAPLS